MKVIHVDTGREWRGGQSQVLMLAKGLRDYGCNTIIIAKKGSVLAERARGEDIPVQELPFRFEADIASAHRLFRFVGSDTGTILHAHTPHALGLILLARGLSSAPPVVFTRRVAFPLRKNAVNQWKLKQPDRIIAVSNTVATELIKAGIPKEKIKVIYSGVDLNLFSYHGPCLRKPFGIGIAGSVEKEKGLYDALDFVEKCSDLPVIFHFLGIGSASEALKEFAASHTNIVIHGFVENIVPLMKTWFALLSFSLSEGFPNTVLQAMAFGLPVLARDNAGTREMICDDRYGSLFDNLTSAVAKFRVMLENTDSYVEIGKQASERVRSLFSKEEMVRNNYEIYKEILE